MLKLNNFLCSQVHTQISQKNKTCKNYFQSDIRSGKLLMKNLQSFLHKVKMKKTLEIHGNSLVLPF